MSRQLDLMSLSFHRRWEKVGVRADLEDLLHPPPLEGHEQSFSSISASQRLVYLDSVRPVSKEVTIEATPLPYETKPKAKPKPNKKILQKMALVNVLMGVEDAPEVNPRGLPYDPLETVLAGMQELHDEDGPMAVLQQRRLAKFRQQRPPTAVRRCTEKAPAMAPTPLLDASWQPESREKRRFNQPKRLLALGEFNSWAQRTFGSLEAARDALGMAGRVSRDQFVEALTEKDYPFGGIGAKTLFFFCDSDEDSAISWQDIACGLEEAPAPGPSCWEALSQHAEEARKLRCQDPIEEYLIGKHVETLTLRGKPKATFQDGLDGLLKLTWFTEPEVAEFLEFVFSEFRSTSMVWCFLDSKQDGIVTLEDFCREMRCLRSRNHRQPVEAHMLGLFDQLDTNKQNRVRLADVLAQGLDAGKGRQALLARFRGFLEELTSSEDPKMKELRETYTSPSKAFKTSAAGKVTRANFIEGLYRLQYDEWHLSSLFARIDRDGSGDITMEDLLNFLREAGPGGRYRMPVATRAMPEVRERGTNKLVQLNHSSIDASAKLSQLNDWFSDERRSQREMQRQKRRPITSPSTKRLFSTMSMPSLRTMSSFKEEAPA